MTAGFEQLGTQAAQLGQSFGLVTWLIQNIILALLMASPIIIIVIAVVILKDYKHKIQIRKETSDGTDVVLTETRFKLIKKDGTNDYLQMLKGFKKHPAPDGEFLEIRGNGSYFLIAYDVGNGILQYAKTEKDYDEGTVQVLQKQDDGKVVKVERKIQIPKRVISETAEIDFDFYHNMSEKREQRYKINNIWETINRVGPSIIMLIFMIMLFSYWSDLQAPNIQREQTALQREEIQLQITQTQSRILERQERILGISTIPDGSEAGNVVTEGAPN